MTLCATHILRGFLLVLCLFWLAPLPVTAQETAPVANAMELAPLRLDGRLLLEMRGASALPAHRRVAQIHARLVAAAEDDSFDPVSVRLVEIENGIELRGPERYLLTIFDADARIEGLEAAQAAQAVRTRLVEAIEAYRQARSPEGVERAIKVIAIATFIFAAVMAALVLSTRFVSRLISRHLRASIELLERKSQSVVRRQDFWKALKLGTRVVFVILGLIAFYFYLNTALLELPWTRAFAVEAFAFVLQPLFNIGRGLLHAIPDLIVILVIIVIARYVLKLVRAFFSRVRGGAIKLQNFEPEWALPTERLLRFGIVAFAIVMAYPYIPGSSSDAFKGISIFAGVILSLGSSSMIANIVAGYTMIYRRAFRVGDWVEIAGVIGRVAEMRMLATHLRTSKNELVTFPNAQVLNSQVVNYTAQMEGQSRILHTEIAIGYDVPWRKVEALLKEAAGRTAGLRHDPAPFVLQRRLNEFAPVYEINGYFDGTGSVLGVHSALHANIQDVFAENGIQIMTPAYENDPKQAKIPPKIDSAGSIMSKEEQPQG